jgi:hypothetical protein
MTITQPHQPQNRNSLKQFLPQILLALVSAVCFGLYFWRLEWTVPEFARFIVAAVALWLPGTLVISYLTRNVIQPSGVRVIFSIGGAYGLTTPLYYVARLANLEAVFWGTLIGIGIVFAIGWWRQRQHIRLPSLALLTSIDWLLLCIIALSLLVNLRYEIGFRDDAQGNSVFELYEDHPYHTGLVYELERHTPPLQESMRAGTPERAYHILPHVTTLLLKIVSGQPDALRVHLVYHYFILQVWTVLLFYALGRLLTGRKTGGYLLAALLYILVFLTPRLLPYQTLPLLYFTTFPYFSSSLNLVLGTAPQMYSGLVVCYTILLGVALLSIKAYRREDWGVLPLLTAVLVGVLMRFRLHIFLAFAPMCGLLLLYLAVRYRRLQPLLALAVLGAISVGLYLETFLPIYLPGTSSLTLGYNGLTAAENRTQFLNFIQYWPGSIAIYDWLNTLGLTTLQRDWLWQIVAMTGFVLFDVIGIPWLILLAIYTFTRAVRRELRLLTLFIFGAVATGLTVGIVVKLDYDTYSVAGQSLFHVSWYVFPLVGVVAWLLLTSKRVVVRIPFLLVCLGFVLAALDYQSANVRKTLTDVNTARAHGQGTETQALQWIWENTPHNAVILTNRYYKDAPHAYTISGLTGRAAYIEAAGTITDLQAMRIYPYDNRYQTIETLWQTTSSGQFCNVLATTIVTHVVIFNDAPLQVPDPPCLSLVWTSSPAGVTIWQVKKG